MLWLATENGIARAIVGGNPWGAVSQFGSRASGVYAVLVEPDGRGGERLWGGASGDGLALYEDRRWRFFTERDGLPTSWVRMIQRAPDLEGRDTLWLGFSHGELMRILPGPRFEPVATPWEKSESQAVLHVLARTHDGARELWVATRTAGLYRWRQGAWTDFRPAGAPEKSGVTSMVEQIDAQGKAWLWASGSQGLLRFDGERITTLEEGVGRVGHSLSGLSLFRDGGRDVLWVGSTDRGLKRVDVTDPRHPKPDTRPIPPPPDPYVYGALRDSRGRTYVCTNNGVQRLMVHDEQWISHVSRRRDGMPHDECNTNAQFIDAHDRYWVGTLGGLGVYDPSQARIDREPKPLRLTHLRSGGQPLSPGEGVDVPHGSELEAEFALLSWRDGDRSRFRTWLIGGEPEPRAWTSQRTRSFERLAPGDYTLRIEARDEFDNPSVPVSLSIQVLPAWWQTGLARAVGFLAFVLLLHLALQWRTGRCARASRRWPTRCANAPRSLPRPTRGFRNCPISTR